LLDTAREKYADTEGKQLTLDLNVVHSFSVARVHSLCELIIPLCAGVRRDSGLLQLFPTEKSYSVEQQFVRIVVESDDDQEEEEVESVSEMGKEPNSTWEIEKLMGMGNSFMDEMKYSEAVNCYDSYLSRCFSSAVLNKRCSAKLLLQVYNFLYF
jgi:hypothetical protein